MKEFSSVDIFYLLKELQLEGAKIDQIYQPGDILIRVHIPNEGKKILRITKRFFFLTDFKEEQAAPKGFCTFLRKTLLNGRIRKIEQVGFERIIKITIEKMEKYHMYIELYSKGNIILTDKDDIIIVPLHQDKRNNIFKGNKYNPPEKDIDIHDFKESEIKPYMDEKSLAVDVGLGGFYAKYVMNSLDTVTAAKLSKALKALLKHKIEPSVVDNKLIPFAMGEKIEGTYNDLLDAYLTKQLRDEERNKKLAPYLLKKKKVENIIEVQGKEIGKQEKAILDNGKKAELLYENEVIFLTRKTWK